MYSAALQTEKQQVKGNITGELLFEIKGYERLVTHTECIWLGEVKLPVHKLDCVNNMPQVQRLLSLF